MAEEWPSARAIALRLALATLLSRRLTDELERAERRVAALSREVDHWKREAVWRAATVLGETAREGLAERNRADALAKAVAAHRDALTEDRTERDQTLYAELQRTNSRAQAGF